MAVQDLLRQIPQIDALLHHEKFAELICQHGLPVVREGAKALLERVRTAILAGEACSLDSFMPECLALRLSRELEAAERRTLRPLINCTGILLHTNLGRAPLGADLAHKLAQTLSSYSNLEYDLDAGKRGSRYSGLEALLTEVCHSEAALVVNNNAAAMLLILSCFAKEREVVVSRGELVEIGGAFRIPAVMEASGAILHEVGTTNKTHRYDYENAINEQTAILLKVHRSNFRIEGFTEEVSLAELKELAQARGQMLVYDLGSGLMAEQKPSCFRDEPSLPEALAVGPDLICFSGDKLFGGPQAGIILGRRELIEQLKRHPLTRALRVDKMTITALTEVLKVYRDPERVQRELPLYRMLNLSLKDLEERIDGLADRLHAAGIPSGMQHSKGQIGGGSTPGIEIDSLALSLKAEDIGLPLQEVEARLREQTPAVIAYVKQEQLLFDLRTVQDCELNILAEAIIQACRI